MKHDLWFEDLTHGDSVRAAALKANVPQRTLANQVDRGEITAENVIKLAMAYDAHPVRALVDTGYLDEQYASEVDPRTALMSVSEDDLAAEVLRRMHLGTANGALNTPIDELQDDLARRRTSTSHR